jgi:hypothetical protein
LIVGFEPARVTVRARFFMGVLMAVRYVKDVQGGHIYQFVERMHGAGVGKRFTFCDAPTPSPLAKMAPRTLQEIREQAYKIGLVIPDQTPFSTAWNMLDKALRFVSVDEPTPVVEAAPVDAPKPRAASKKRPAEPAVDPFADAPAHVNAVVANALAAFNDEA